MHGEIKYKILDVLEDGAMAIIDFHNSIMSVGYGASLGKLEYEQEKRNEKRWQYQRDRENRRKLQKYISKLKSDGLIIENSTEYVSLSKKGKEKLSMYKQKISVNKNNYKKELGSKVIIISYDLPIIFKRERDILRDVLKILGFNMIHQSVWIGKIKIPKQFVIDLEKMKILEYIEILEVTKTGSLKSYN
jgi:hypothetical protein